MVEATTFSYACLGVYLFYFAWSQLVLTLQRRKIKSLKVFYEPDEIGEIMDDTKEEDKIDIDPSKLGLSDEVLKTNRPKPVTPEQRRMHNYRFNVVEGVYEKIKND